MILSERGRVIASTVVVATVGVGALYVLFNRKKIIRRLTDPLYGQSVQIITNTEECRNVIGTLRSHCQEFRVLGFDCEWVSEQGNRHPVALLQLASHRGLCALFKLCEMKQIPPELGDLLNDPAILKVGVGPVEDAKLLRTDYNLKVESTMDLRHLAKKSGHPGPYGLARMSESMLGVKLDKHWRVRASNWENEELTERQIQYAANDAHVSVELFRKLAKLIVPRGIWTSRKNWFDTVASELECYLDQRYYDKPGKNNCVTSKKGKKNLLEISKGNNLEIKRSMATRSSPLYDNCEMQAPNGEILCTCDRKKAEWYVLKGLAEIVAHHPTFTIRLNFEPKGRAVGDVGKYYQSAKENQCVVCGGKDSYVRKNIIPREYRRNFPLILKENNSHDVLLLCAPCHQSSTMHDDNMRLKLASMCTAPLSSKDNRKEIRVECMSELRKAARAVVYNGKTIPEERKKGLFKRIQKLLPNGTEITPELLQHYANINVSIPNSDYRPHGATVVEYFKQQPGGLIELERMWREHFLQSMKPKYMPELWSVEHNLERLGIRADEGRLKEQEIEGVGVSFPTKKNTPPVHVYDYNLSNNSGPSSSNPSSLTSNGSSDEHRGDLASDESTSKDVASYRDEEAAVTMSTSSNSASNQKTRFFSNRNETETLYDTAASGSSGNTTLGQVTSGDFKTVVPPSTSAERDESEMGTVKDIASIASSYDSDNSDSTLSQPSMTLLNSTDDWEAEATEPSVNGPTSVTLSKGLVGNRINGTSDV
ncbi:exonuclease 3'-5' domain-containing protein 2 [Toxorhynchites rutilus septentrionalis]|uniref:exonuclease 3'-5' domain-containing protein 2 n=1 Tax=Toxorhynchites rutilus septentrionalis TaxID=329112 RepID=UPI0024783FEE|nr:exonuclease 3'-5' domain-containing protein 2 [Toxorhynchites rutilus septentrionalis]XP_055642856.1 exonuclease 3'-5' domain-containing protein 2 [Toxorhynchites rutilus septentrionalis]